MELRRGHRDKSSLPRDQNLPVNHSHLPPPLPHLTQGAQVWGPQQVTLFRSEQDQNPGGGASPPNSGVIVRVGSWPMLHDKRDRLRGHIRGLTSV